MTLSEELQWRGLIKDKTFSDISWLDEPKAFYLGNDCSADSLHIGNLATLMLAKRLYQAGWKAVLLVGGATSLIGDPGGKTEERQLKSRKEIIHNVAGIEAQIQKLFGDDDFELVDNYDWFKDINFLEFLRDVGKHYSMTELLQRDFIADRIGQDGGGISYAEFSYSLIQGYDYWHLFKERGVVLQIGGSDQWGNMLSGVPLIRKKENQEVHAMSMPLVINKATGKKFGKSEDGAVWLDPAQTSPFKFYQFWLNVDDEGAEDYLKVFTELPKEEIDNIMAEFSQNKSGRAAQKTLAYEVTQLVHGQDQAEQQRRLANILMGNADALELQKSDFEVLAHELPVARLSRPITLEATVDVLVSTKLAASKTEARRLLAEDAVYINNCKIKKDGDRVLLDTAAGYAVIRRGKAFKDSALVELEN